MASFDAAPVPATAEQARREQQQQQQQHRDNDHCHTTTLSLDDGSSSSSADQYECRERKEVEGGCELQYSDEYESDTTRIFAADVEYDEDGVDDDPDNGDSDRTTNIQTFLHIIKGNVGPGCLSLPWATSVLGIRPSLVALASLCLITSFNCRSVVHWKRRHATLPPGSSGTNGNGRDLSYADLGEIAYGPKFRSYVSACVVTTQLCVCTVFLSFMGENVAAVARAAGIPMLDDERVVVSVLVPLAMLLSCAPNLRVLAPATACGMGLLAIAFGCVGAVMFWNWDDRPAVSPSSEAAAAEIGGDWSKAPLAMCAFLYSFEAINLVVPIEAAMMHPAAFDRVFFAGMVAVTALYAAFAVLCVTAFGNVDDGSVTAFLMERSSGSSSVGGGDDEEEKFAAGTRNLVLAANLAISMSVLVTYPLQLFPAIVLVGQWRARRRDGARARSPAPQSVAVEDDDCGADDDGAFGGPGSHEASSTANFMPLDAGRGEGPHGNPGAESGRDITKRGYGPFRSRTTFEGDSPLLRAALVLGTYLFAILIPNVQELISLSGAVAGSSAALIIPPCLELRSILENNHRFSPRAMLRYNLLAVGVVFLVVGTVASVMDIVRAFRGDGER